MAKGILTNAELVDTLIVDLNNLPKQLLAGQFIQACAIVTQMGQKLINLRKGIADDLKYKDERIEQLKEQLRNLGAEVTDMTPDEFMQKYDKKDGTENGGS